MREYSQVEITEFHVLIGQYAFIDGERAIGQIRGTSCWGMNELCRAGLYINGKPVRNPQKARSAYTLHDEPVTY